MKTRIKGLRQHLYESIAGYHHRDIDYVIDTLVEELSAHARNEALEEAAEAVEREYDGIRFARIIRALKVGE